METEYNTAAFICLIIHQQVLPKARELELPETKLLLVVLK